MKCVCVLGESCGPETPAASLLWEGSSLSLPLGPQRAAAGRVDRKDKLTLTLSASISNFLSFLCIRLFWVSVTFWRLIPTSYTCGIPSPLVHCFTLPVPNCRGRCWPSFACMSLLDQTVTASAVVRPQLVPMNPFVTWPTCKYVASLWYLSFTALNDVFAEFDTIRLFSHSSAKGESFSVQI